MYYVEKDLGNGMYSVMDTKDNVAEAISVSTIQQLVNKGVSILGVTNKGIYPYNIKTKQIMFPTKQVNNVPVKPVSQTRPPVQNTAQVASKPSVHPKSTAQVAQQSNSSQSNTVDASNMLWVLAELRDLDDSKTGYRICRQKGGMFELLDLQTSTIKEMCEAVKTVGSNFVFQNANYNESTGDLDFPNLDKSGLPVLKISKTDDKFYLQGRGGITILYKVTDDNDKTMGYGIIDTMGGGSSVPISKKKLFKIAYTYKQVNYKIDNRGDGSNKIVTRGLPFPVVRISDRSNFVKSYNSVLDSPDDVKMIREANAIIIADREIKSMGHFDDDSSEFKSSGSNYRLPSVKVYGVKDTDSEEFNAQCSGKFLMAVNNLRKVSPYYSSVLQAIPRVATTAVPTMAVSEDRMFYNPAFVASLSKAELTFILIHEMLHMVLQHTLRGRNKQSVIWNIANDLYINELICRDFGLTFGDADPKMIAAFPDEPACPKGELQTPLFGIFCHNQGIELDFAVDTSESLYNQILKENPELENQLNQQSQQQQQNQSGQGQNQGGQSGQSGQDSQDGQGQGQNGQGQDDQGSSSQDNGQGQNGQDGTGQGQSGSGQGQSGSGQGQNDSSQGQGGSGSGSSIDDILNKGSDVGSGSGSDPLIDKKLLESDNADVQKIFKDIEISLKGRKLIAKVPLDIVSNNENQVTADDVEKAQKQSQNLLQRIHTKVEIDEKKREKEYSSMSSIIAERQIAFGLASKYDWIQLLKNVCKAENKKLYTYTRLNKPYTGMGLVLPSKVDLGKPEKITDIKFAIDVSGSVSQEELNSIFTKINDILDVYKLDAELIYWDTQITNAGSFKNLKQLVEIKPLGFGGTDPECIFKYLTRETDFQGEKEKSTVKNISAVLIFTDGCFSFSNAKKYAPYFTKNTIWVLNEGCPPFDAPFGKIAVRKED